MKKRPRRRAVISLIALWTLAIFARTDSAEKKYDLKYRMKPKEEFSLLNMHISHRGLKTPTGMDKVGSLTRNLELNYTVVAADTAGMTFEVEYKKKLYQNTDRDGKIAVTDFAAILGKKVKYTISPTGELSRFEGFEEMPAVKMPNGGTYTGAFLREEIEHMFPTLPEKPISKGGTWTRNAFGARIEYQLIDEVKLFGFDCLRIFAKIEDEQTIARRKDRDGNEITVETTEPYSDIYYFAYKEGMMLSRFSVASFAQSVVKNAKNELISHQIFDVLYETFVHLKSAEKMAER